MTLLHQLKTFCVLVEEGSFTRAAEKLYLSQPSVSQHISTLEKEYDVSLFNRRGRRLSLTPEGNALYTLALDVLKRSEAIPARFREMQAMRYGRLDLGVSTYVGTSVIPPFVAAFRSIHPDVAMTLQTGNDPDIHKMLRQGEIEIAILEGNARTFNDKDLKTFVIGQDDILLVAPADHPWRGGPGITPSKLNDEHLILYEKDCSLCPFIQEYLMEQRIDQHRGTFVNSRDVARALVKAGAGLAFINRGSVKEDLQSGNLVSIPMEGLSVKKLDIVCFYRQSTGLGFAGWAFRRILEKGQK
ncbi:LysR family transcriptional regulator [Dethiosulfovibrio salsuginis]|uniref:DNA-binding transcriptional regulator, LysR family n=1 Tax=Dethiosulfovibrio salsuginis TaxID=561720 RepID=A0A1X7KAC2_9BACT|nr:LysR family transcriptional regulator [Dethiosulfovibrio salsuginis]SMG37403.1 DNA-binding transcriptional regulator, LysR family [Dethiosulfovibrio salsuginis]